LMLAILGIECVAKCSIVLFVTFHIRSDKPMDLIVTDHQYPPHSDLVSCA